MTVFDFLSMIGGLCMFLFGMSIMGQALERCAGGKLELTLSKMTSGKIRGLLTGLGITAVIQSSSATTVMVVGFVNSGLMSLGSAINVIMGANIGTTVTAWILSLGGISGDNIFVNLLKPTSFTPVLALVGIVLYTFTKSNRKKDIGMILLGFSVLMFGMDAMTDSVGGLSEVEGFRNMFVAFEHPLLGVAVGAILTAIIQSSSASVGILQAFAATGAISFGAAVPIIMGQNIGTCITAILASFGTNRNAKRAAIVHLAFNVIGTAVWLAVFTATDLIFSPAILDEAATISGIAVAHSLFNLLCTLLLLPLSGVLEKIVVRLVPDQSGTDVISELDELLLATPAVAIERCRTLTHEMAELSTVALNRSMKCITEYSTESAAEIRRAESRTDHLEDIIGTYLVKLGHGMLTDKESAEVSMLLKLIGDYERICDHAENIVESAEELIEKKITFSGAAAEELKAMCNATEEILSLAYRTFIDGDYSLVDSVEPLEEVIDEMKAKLRSAHIARLSRRECSIEAGFVWSDLITDLERVADHCSNIAGCALDASRLNMSLHESQRIIKTDNPEYRRNYLAYAQKYL